MFLLDTDFKTQLKTQLSQELPGVAAHKLMAHHLRYVNVPAPDDAKIASVLLALYPKNEAWHIVLMKRTSRFKNDKHKGQVSFPGGQKETADPSDAYTALREAQEEVGLPMEAVEILGKLTDFYIPVSNFLVHPFVGILTETPTFIPDTSEVVEIIELPLSSLLDDGIMGVSTQTMGNGVTLKDIPHFNVNGHIVWGATCMMLSEFKEVVKGLK